MLVVPVERLRLWSPSISLSAAFRKDGLVKLEDVKALVLEVDESLMGKLNVLLLFLDLCWLFV